MADSFKTRNIKRRPMKRRSEPTEDSSSEDETRVVRRSKNINENNPMVQGTKREKVNKSENEAEDSGDEDSILVSYKSKRDAHPELPKDMGATSTVQIDTDISDATQHTHNNPQNTVNAENGECCQSSSKSSSKISMAMKGPMRAPANLRSTVRWDYQPDICKDYKETGFCGFGDSCKFLHDRTDYKFGWQLERESINDNQDDDHKYEVDDSDDENLPFKCIICRGSFVDPIVTKCGHYFCEKCVLNRYKKTDRCFVCNTQTNGVFNPAKKLIAALKERPNTERADDENSDECDT